MRHPYFPLILLVFSLGLAQMDAHFYFPNGASKTGKLLYMKDDTLHILIKKNGAVLRRAFPKQTFGKVVLRDGPALNLEVSGYGDPFGFPPQYRPANPSGSSAPTVLEVHTDPPGAQVTLVTSSNRRIRLKHLTPVAIAQGLGDASRVELATFRVGSLDTTLIVKLERGDYNCQVIRLRDTDLSQAIDQRNRVRKKHRHRVSGWFLTPSACALAGGCALLVLAQTDAAKADEAKAQIRDGISESSKSALVDRYNKYAKAANTKRQVSYGLLGGGGACLAVGIILRF